MPLGDNKLFQLFNKKVFKIEPGLERIRDALGEIGNPHLNFPSILVAGTNGKGSTCAYTESLFRNHGYTTGLFTSPHLIEENERWQINRQIIPNETLERYILELKPVIERYNLTYFEACTLLAFKYFSDMKVDIAVVEVGLGGRWDATNILYPDVSVITNVSFDHTDILGKKLIDIAFEKTGITRPDRPVVVGRNQDEIIYWLKERFIRETYVSGIDFKYNQTSYDTFDYISNSVNITDINLSMIGLRQIENASTALTTFLVYTKFKDIQIEKIKESLSKTKWDGRMEILSKDPLIVIDGSHNVEGIEKTFQELREIFPKSKFITVYSFLKDKDVESMFKIIQQNSAYHIGTKINISRGMDKADFIRIGEEKFIERPFEAVKEAISISDKDNSVIVILGSLYLIGEIVDGWDNFSK